MLFTVDGKSLIKIEVVLKWSWKQKWSQATSLRNTTYWQTSTRKGPLFTNGRITFHQFNSDGQKPEYFSLSVRISWTMTSNVKKKTAKLLQLFFNLLISLPITSQLQKRLSDTSCIEDHVIFVEVVTIYYFAAYQFAEIRINGTETLPQIVQIVSPSPLIFPPICWTQCKLRRQVTIWTWWFEFWQWIFFHRYMSINYFHNYISMAKVKGHHHFTRLCSPTSCNSSLSTESNYIMVTNT